MRTHSESERSVWYGFLIHGRVSNYHYPTPTFRTVSEGVFSETHIQHRAQEPPSPGPSIVAIDARGCLLPGAEGATRSHLLVGGAAPLPALASPSFPGGGGGSGR